ncbi:MAG: alanine racemase [Magnetococcales bacterium]|nr:alanine racemase [Magnetococcales bacterium]
MPTITMDNSSTHVARFTWLEINLTGVVENFLLAQKNVGNKVKVFPVVKADGYGLGALPISRALVAAGAPGLCVGLVEEAEELRQGGIEVPLIVFAGLTPGTEQFIIDLDLTPFIYTLDAAKALNNLAVALNKKVSCYIKVDTGMGRIGFSQKEFVSAIKEIKTMPGIKIAGLVSHLSCSDEEQNGEVTNKQIDTMQEILTAPELVEVNQGFNSLANSGGILYHPNSHMKWVRPGIMLYGASPAYPRLTSKHDGVVGVVNWFSRIIQITQVSAGTPLGYGHSYTTNKTSKIAQIPVGYGDGYSRSLSNKGYVLIAGIKAPIVGRVCMDITAVDVTDIPDAKVGSLVTILGKDGSQQISIEMMASWLDTIPYEVICNIGKRVPRYYPSKK